jgi:hypothetical protein
MVVPFGAGSLKVGGNSLVEASVALVGAEVMRDELDELMNLS